ncbi:MAG TPA: PTS sugar transporter subunit IIA, partial [Tepidisphaeraceae bacterium]|nr:PTS sugar transporter subunit IIA [Tepidisphaeraceae bacterium]
IPGLSAPVAALAVTRAGVLDAPTSSPVDVVFLLLAPGDDPGAHLRALAAAGRLLSDRERRRELLRAPTPETAFNVLVGK